MTSTKIYTATPADLSPPVQSESFCVDLVLASDYRELEAKCVALAAENAVKQEFIKNCFRVAGEGAVCVIRAPATDAFLAEMRAQGVDLFAKREITDAVAELIGGSVDISLRLRESADRADEFAAQLRQGAAQ
ncbi:hypothetical protein ABX050_002406 [Salmonella enterica]